MREIKFRAWDKVDKKMFFPIQKKSYRREGGKRK
jgi:hypothetical protein